MSRLSLRGRASACVRAVVSLSLSIGLLTASAAASSSPPPDARQALSRLHTPFVQNQGQQPADVAFSANAPWGAAVVSRNGEIAYLVAAGEDAGLARFVKERWVGAAPAEVRGEQRLATRINLFQGSDPSQWRHDLPAYRQVSLGKVYPGIEIKLLALASNVEKLFLLDPQADPARIRVRPSGVTALNINANGELVLKTPKGPVTFSRPVAYQEQGTERVYVDVAYRVTGKDYGFKLGAYDAGKPLVIDPVLASAAVGGSASDNPTGMAIAADGSVYLSGNTYSVDLYATQGVFDTTFSGPYAGTDAFVAKLSADLTQVLALTYLGGSTNGNANAIALDSAGAVFVTGSAGSSSFPTASNGYQRTCGCATDGFILKLSPDLATLLGGTFLGGSGNDIPYALLIDAYDNVYVGGTTRSANFPVSAGAMDTSWGGGSKTINRFRKYSWGDGFVAKLDNGLTTLLASTFIGGAKGDEVVRRLAFNSQGEVLALGWTGSPDFPATAGAFDTTYNGGANLIYSQPWGDAFVSKMDGNLSSLLASTVLGGSAIEYAWALALDGQGNVYVGGETYSSNFPFTAGVVDAAGPTNTTYTEGFISKFNPGLTALSASTFLGGAYNDAVGGLAIDGTGNIHVVGNTNSSDFPKTAGSAQGGLDAFAARMNGQMTTLFESELIGVSGNDSLGMIAFGPDGTTYAAGYTTVTVSLSSVSDARIVKLGAVDLSLAIEDSPDPVAPGNALNYVLSILNTGGITATGVNVSQTLPDHASFVSAAAAQGTCSHFAGTGGQGGTVSCAIGTLAGNAGTTVDVVVIPTDSGTYTSSASVTSTEPDSNPSNDTASAVTTVGTAAASADLGIAVTDSPDPVAVGGNLTYAVTVTNNSAVAVTGITVSDTLPGSVAFISASAAQGVCAEMAGVVNCYLGTLGGNASTTASIVVSPGASGTLSNSLTVSASDPDPNPANNTAVVSTSVVALADLALGQSAAPSPATVGANLTYGIAVSNSGPNGASSVVVSDSLPAGVSFVSANATQGACTQFGGSVNCNLGSLASGTGASVSIVVTPTVGGVTLSNTASISASETDPNLGNNSATSSVPVSGGSSSSVDLRLEQMIDSPDPVMVGETLNYSVRLYNNSGYAASVVVVEDVLPAGVTFVAGNVGGTLCTFNAGVVRCELQNLYAWSTVYPSISVVPTVSGLISNTFTVTGSDPDPNPANNSISTTTSVMVSDSPADMSASLTGPGDGNIGVTMTYSAIVSNGGPGNASNVVLTDTLPAGMQFGSATPSQGSCSFSAGTVTCQLGSMASGATATVTLNVVPYQDGGTTNTVTVSATQTDPAPKNNSASVETEIR